MTVLALVGITGMYLRQVKRTGVLGLLGYLLFGAGYLLMLSIEVIGLVVLPALAASRPRLRQRRPRRGHRRLPRPATSAWCSTLSLTSGIGYMVGGLVFGIALFRAGVLARWASALLAIEHRRHPRDPPAAAGQPAAVRHPQRRRPDRPRLLAVARAAHLGTSDHARASSAPQLDPIGAK